MSDPEQPEQAYHPNASEPQAGTLYCFKDVTRPCGADCMAYLPQVPNLPMYQGEQWAHCMVLLSQERESRHIAIIATELITLRRKQEADRVNSVKPPLPK